MENKKLTLATIKSSLVPELMPMLNSDLEQLRNDLNMSQAVFAAIFNVTVRTAQSWAYKPNINVTGSTLVIANQLMRGGLNRYLDNSHLMSSEGFYKKWLFDLYSDLKKSNRGSGYVATATAVDKVRVVLGLEKGEHAKATAEKIALESTFNTAASISEMLKQANENEALQLVECWILDNVINTEME